MHIEIRLLRIHSGHIHLVLEHASLYTLKIVKKIFVTDYFFVEILVNACKISHTLSRKPFRRTLPPVSRMLLYKWGCTALINNYENFDKFVVREKVKPVRHDSIE